MSGGDERLREPIAILGAGIRLPGGVSTVPGFWELLASGTDAVGPVPVDRWDPVRWGTPPAGAFLTDPYRFDAAFFGISPREAADMDPAQRLLLEVAWEALEQGGRAPDQLVGTRTGVWVGLSLSDWSRRHFGGADPTRLGPHAGTGSLLSVSAGRIAYTLGLQGPAMTVDTACSSSLVAIHLAVQSLRRGEVDLALAGGASLLFHPMPSVYFGRLGALSADGRCRTFDAAAGGYGRGEGVGLFALARLSDAASTGLPLLGLIRGTAVNQDGRSSGLTAPNGSAQQQVVRDALADAGASPDEVAYVEAHGTGTPLGDPVELDALRAVFLPRAAPLHVGSVKTNLAHLESAAGVPGLLKAALILRNGSIPPHLHLRTPNPRLRLDGIVIDEVLTPLPPGLAGVSGFGLSGTNAHVVLGAPPGPPPPTGTPPGPVVVTLSARSGAALRATATRWADAVPGDVSAFAATAATRAALPHRAAVVGETPAALSAALRQVASGGGATGVAPRRPPGVAFLFAGQGAQLPGMGRALADADEGFRRALQRVAEAVDQASADRPLLDVMWSDSAALNDTRWTQPALFALEVALAAWWRGRGVEPDLLVGHSIGELSAATVAGVFSLEAGARLAVARGRCLSSLPRDGAMWAVLAPEEEVLDRISGAPVDVAAVNHPGETVLAGRRVDLEALGARLAGLEVRPLLVSHPFHSRWVEPALGPFEAAVRAETLALPGIPLVSAVDGAVLGARAVDPAFWRDHVRAAVRFGAALRTAWDDGATVFLELSARPVLGGMVERVLPPAAVRVATLRPPRPEPQAAAEALAQAWVAGVPVSWPGGPGVADLPPGAFDADHHFVPDPTASPPGLPLFDEATAPAHAATGPTPPLVHHVTGEDVLHALAAFAALQGGPWWVVAPDTAAGAAVYGGFLALAAEAPARAGGFVWCGGPPPPGALGLPGVVRVRDGRAERVVLEAVAPAPGVLALAGGTVLVTGATGGLGPALLAWLAARGAGRVVVVSRAGRVPDGVPAGLLVEGLAWDLTAPEGLGAVVAALPGLVGVVHAAAVVDDAPVGTHDAGRLHRVLAVKLGAVRELDRATRGRGLPLFLALSSASAWVGTPGQLPYAAANRALEALIRERRAAGERATAVALGPLAGAGLGNAPPALVARWEREGMPRSAVADAIGAMDRTVLGERAVVLAVPFDWAAVRAARAQAPTPPPGPVSPAAPQVPPVANDPTDLATLVARVVRATLGYAPDAALDPDAGLFDLGMDSVTAVDVARRLQDLLGRKLPATVAIDHPTITRLVAHLGAQPASAQPPPTPGGVRGGAVAIVGLSCRLPGGLDDLGTLWELLVAGGDVLGPVPSDRFDPEDLGSAPRRGGFVRDLQRFDRAMFGLSAAEARVLDPQHRLLLEGTFAAFEDAGLQPRASDPTGVFVAVEPGDYALRLRGSDDPYALTGNQPSMASGRLSYVFGFQGPSLSVDTACSSGLVALASAVRELRAGTCVRAVVGAVNALTDPEPTRAMAALGALSPNGVCRPFDGAANGYVRAEGCVVLILEPLALARAAGRRILGVVEGVAVGHDGAAAGLTVPNGPAQERVIRAALADAGCGPDDVDAIECHGTGTPLGDPIEYGALASVFAERGRPLWLGAVKANVGHLEAAAGLVGVAAALLRLQHGAVPPIAGLTSPNPALPSSAVLQLPTALRTVPVQRVGVSAFGLTGTDAHVVLAAEVPHPPAQGRGPWLLPLSGRTDEQVRSTAARWLRRFPSGAPVGVEATLLGREAAERRACGVFTGVEGARAWLAAVAEGAAPVAGPGEAPALVVGGVPSESALAELRTEPAYAAAWDEAAASVAAVRDTGEATPLAEVLVAAWAWASALRYHGARWSSVVARGDTWPVAACLAGVYELPVAARLCVHGGRLLARRAEPAAADDWRRLFASVMLRRPTSRLEHERLGGDAVRRADAWRDWFVDPDPPGPAPEEPTLAGLRTWLASAWERGQAAPRARTDAREAAPTRAPGGEWCWVPHPSLRPAVPRWRIERVVFTPSLRAPGGEAATVDASGVVPTAGDPVAAAQARVAAHARWLVEAPPGHPVVLVTRQADTDPVQAALAGLAVTAAVELGDRVHHHVDLDEDLTPALLELLARLDLPPGRSDLRDGAWSRPVLVPDPDAPPTRWSGPVVLTGAGGALAGALRSSLEGMGVEVLGLARTLPTGLRGLALDLAHLDGPELRERWASAGLPRPATVVHAAGQPADAPIGRWSDDLLERAFGVRVRGALAIRAAFPAARHVTVGSAAAVVGNPGQGAYAAAHGYLRALGGATALGPVAGEGSAAGVDWGTRGVRPLPPDQVAELLGGGIALAVDWPRWARGVPRVPPLVAELVGPPSGPLPGEVAALVERVVSDVLGRPADPDRGLFESGLDSIGVLAVAQRLGRALRRDVPATLLFDHPTPRGLAAALLGAEIPAAAPVAARLDDDPVVVVGLALRLPGGVEDLGAFQELLAEGRDVVGPTPPERWDDARFPELAGMGASWLDWRQVQGFDPVAFGMAPREAAATDPQQRLLLILATEALERAGLSPSALRGSRTAVFVGAGDSGYLDRFQRPGEPRYTELHAGTGNLSAFASGRVAHALGLRGPNLTLNTACSSSLVAVHLARRALLDGEASVALAGGVHLMLSPEHTRYLARLGALSPTGRCRTFDAAADGYARGEGAGLFVLMRRSSARAGGHPVLAVLRGSALGHDGAASGLTVPSGPAQEEVLRLAQADAGVGPDDVDYVEAHGTGTPLGDPIEVEALLRVFGPRGPDHPLLLGSVKAAVGHLELAAGVASLAKVIGMFGSGRVPPQLHLATPAPGLQLGARGYVVPTTGGPWAGRLAGISSFGLSGTNVHLLLSAGDPTPPPPAAGGPAPTLLAWSAPSPGALVATTARLARHLGGSPSLLDTSHGLLAHRDGRRHRAFVVAEDAAQAADAVATAVVGEASARGPVAFLFTGQGSQVPGMGRGLESRFPVVRDTFREARDILGGALFEAWDDARIHHTRVTQPALLVLEVALTRWWATLGVVPDIVLGHSVGHFAAAVAAGVLTFPDALRLVDARARLLASLPEGVGAMVSVDAPEGVVAAALVPGAVLAATNHPASCTISGEEVAVEQTAAALRAQGLRATRLTVSHAFHSPLVQGVVEAFAAEVSRVALRPAAIPVVSNLDGRVVSAAELERPAWWAELLRAPVRFREGLETIGALHPALVVELGPHPVLAGMARATLGGTPAVVASLRHGEEPVRSALRAAGEVFVAGRTLDPAGLFPGRSAPAASGVVVTAYDAAVCWLEEVAPATTEPVYREDWRAIDAPPGSSAAAGVIGDGPWANALRTQVPAGALRIRVYEDDRPEGLSTALEELRAGLDVVVTVGARTRPWLRAIHGLLRSLAAEDPRRAPRWLDVDGDVDVARVAARLGTGVSDVRVTSTHVLQRVLVPATLPAAPPPLVVTVVTGGLSGLGHAVARALLAGGAPGLVLVGRAEPAEDVLTWIRAADVPVVVVRGDVADPAVVDAAVAAAEELAQGDAIGVVHAAGALADRAFDQVTTGDLERASAAKVRGALHLDARVGRAAYFLCFGAGAALLGTAGQAAYAAANAALAAVVEQRLGRGLPAVVVDWGAWAEVGMAARLDPALQRRRMERGLGTLSVADGTAWALRALAAPGPELAVLPTDWRRYVEVVHGGHAPPLLALLVPATQGVGPLQDLARVRLAGLRGPERTAAVTGWVDGVVRTVLGAAHVDPTRSLFDAGLDSLLAIELKNRLMDGGFDVPVAAILTDPTVASLAAVVERLLPAAETALAGEPGPAPPVSPVVSHLVVFALGVLFVVAGYVGTAWLAGFAVDEAPVGAEAPP